VGGRSKLLKGIQRAAEEGKHVVVVSTFMLLGEGWNARCSYPTQEKSSHEQVKSISEARGLRLARIEHGSTDTDLSCTVNEHAFNVTESRDRSFERSNR
jgi:hypothetical protein